MINIPLHGVSAVMTFPEVATMVIGICSMFVLVIIFLQKGKNAMLEENLKTMWRMINENKCKIDETEKHIDRNFHNKDEVREYVDLINAPYLTQMRHINDKLDKMQEMMQSFIDKTSTGKKR